MKAVARPRRGAPAKGEASARERILATANELFYREGIRAIGVDTVVERSGVSKTSLYRLFESKDALIAAFAAERDQSFWALWDYVEEQHNRVASQLAMIINGAYATGLIAESADLKGDLVDAALKLLA